MKQIVLWLAIILVMPACEKNEHENGPDTSIYGRYRGTFHRTGMDTAQVEIGLLSDNRFEGASDKERYPALCGGFFSFDGTVLSVDDTCAWTANFDWSLIFDGNYQVDFTGNNMLKIWRQHGAGTDEYLLYKLVR